MDNRSTRHSLIFRALLAASVLSLPLAVTGPPAQAVVGTPVVDNDYTFTAKLVVGEHARGCSAALVSKEWLLSAASCFVDDPAAGIAVPAGRPKSETVATLGDGSSSAPRQTREVVELRQYGQRDLVLARLAQPVIGIEPVTVSATAAAAGQQLTSVGYGRTAEEWAPVKPHAGSFTADAVNNGEVTVSGKDNASICMGDAGGPVLRATNGKPELVAVSSRSYQVGCYGVESPEGTPNAAVATRVDDVRAWIADNAKQTPAQDYNGDGRSDVATWYDYADGSDKVHLWDGGMHGAMQLPTVAYSADAGTWNEDDAKLVTGDYNGDGRSDIGLFYGYSDGTVKLFTKNAKADSTFEGSVVSWTDTDWTWARMHPYTGDFNGDGRDDIAVWYDYADGSDKVFTFLSKEDGTFNKPFTAWSRASGWTFDHMKVSTGDFNADGRDDLGLMYFYDTGEVKTITLPSLETGAFQHDQAEGWTSGSWGSAERTSVQSGDFNGDGRDELAAWYDYSDGSDAVISFSSTAANGALTARKEIWRADAGRYTRDHMRVVGGDYNGDGRDDLAALYGYDDGSLKMITWAANADGTLNEPLHGAEKTTGWNYDRVSVFMR
ncbi:FG-GAP-like repeat-containing protein [Streptomyces sp. NPDC048109]|uniref:FG-GAP-like repeat-containing protein n=1 Tax=Streptomyces sp. NPDC048109 TaxID=3155482 RepID=UPI00343F5DB9